MASQSSKSAIFALLVLTAVYTFAFVDRQILTMLVAPLKSRFMLSDLDVSFLIGPAFIVSFMAVGLPAGLGVDRFNRRNLVLGAGLVWSIGTAAASFVTNFTELAISRAMVGAAEAVLFPAGMSMIADMFDRRHLPAANSVFLTSPYLGGGLALIAGGHIYQATQDWGMVSLGALGNIAGWQIIFLIVAGMGVIPLLLMAMVTEPERKARKGIAQGTESGTGVGQAFAFIARNWRFYGFFYLGMGVACQVMAMISAWAPTYLSRQFGLRAADIGTNYGGMVLVAGLAGGISGPLVNRWLSRHVQHSTMWAACLGPVMILLFVCLLINAQSAFMTMLCLALFTASYAFPLSTAGGSLQLATPSHMVGMASSIYLICNSVLGYALGPTLVPLVAAYGLGNSELIGPALYLSAGTGGVIALTSLLIAARGFPALVRRDPADAAA